MVSDDQPDVPGERCVVCDHCGWDGGIYSLTTTAESSYCPGCGRPATADGVRMLHPDDEPTALTWPGQ